MHALQGCGAPGRQACQESQDDVRNKQSPVQHLARNTYSAVNFAFYPSQKTGSMDGDFNLQLMWSQGVAR